MSYQKQIHDYLNGDLTSDEEKRLFDELSDNPAFREELAMQIKLHQTVQKDMATNSISPATTAAIFSALNFTVPVKSIPLQSRRRFGFPAKFVGMNTMMSGIAFVTAIGCLVYILLRPSTPQVAASNNNLSNNTLSLQTPADNQNQIISTIPAEQNTDHIQNKKQISKTSDRLPLTTNSENASRRIIPNEPMKVFFDIGKFSSVDYLTPTKIIGVADGGLIYYSENGGKSWAIQESGTSSDLSGINFIDTAQGIIVGSRGTILSTDNAGREWHQKQSGINTNLITIRYANRDTVYACGAQGTILRSITSGKTWERLESGTRLSLFKLFFENGSSGFVTGEHGITLETHNAGASWSTKK